MLGSVPMGPLIYCTGSGLYHMVKWQTVSRELVIPVESFMCHLRIVISTKQNGHLHKPDRRRCYIGLESAWLTECQLQLAPYQIR